MAKFSDKYKWSEYENHDTPLLHRSRSMRSSFRFIANRASMKRSTNNQQTFFQNNYKHLHTTNIHYTTAKKSPKKEQQLNQYQLPPQNSWNSITREMFNDLTKENKRDLPNLPKYIPPKAAKILNIQPIPLHHINQLNQEQKYHHHHKEVERFIPHHQRRQQEQQQQQLQNSGDVKTIRINSTKNQIKIKHRNHLNDNEIQQFENINLNSITSRSRSEERCPVMPPPQFIPPLRSKKCNGMGVLIPNGGHVIKTGSMDQSRK